MFTRRSLLIGSVAANLPRLAGCAPGAPPIADAGLPSAPGKAARFPTGTTRFKGENIGGGDYWAAPDLFIDQIDNAGWSVTGKFTDPASGDVSLPTGNSWSALLRETSPRRAMAHVKLRPGKIRVWWTGTATVGEVSVSAPGWAKVASAGQQAIEITISAENAQDGGQLSLRFENNSGSTKTLIQPHAVYVDDLAAFNAGEIFDPRHLASYPSDIGVIRVPTTCFVHMTNGLDKKLNAELTYDQLVPSATNHFWKHRNYQTAARLAKRLGPDVALWVNANVLMNYAGYVQLAAAIAATGFTGKIILEGGLEFWNYAYPYVMQRERAREVIGPKITVVDGNGYPSSQEGHIDACCYAEKSRQLWEAFAEHFPQPQLIRVLTGQTEWFDILSAMFAYRRDGKGQRCGEIYDANSIAGYAGWTNPDEMWNAGAQNFTPAQWDAEMGRRLTALTAKIDSYKAEASSRPFSKNPNYLMYEGWHHIAVYDTFNVGKASGAAGQGTLTFTSSISGRIETGEFLYSNVAWDWVSLWDSPWPNGGAYARVVDATHVTLHPSAADAAANTRPLKLNATINDATFTNSGRAKAIADSAMAWIHSSHGVAWSDHWWTQMKTRFNSYRCIFEPKQVATGADNMWGFFPPPTNVHSPDGLMLTWWRGVSGA
ncbi:MAG: hypothetical protein ABI616_08705 [Pseudomonadota bacterium]